MGSFGSWDQVKQQGRLPDCHCPVQLFLNNKEPPMKDVSAAITNRGGVNIQTGWRVAVHVEEDGSPLQLGADMVLKIFTDHLEQRVSGRYPLQGSVSLQKLFV